MIIVQQPNFLLRNVNLVPSDVINNTDKNNSINVYTSDNFGTESLPLFNYPSSSIIGFENIDIFNTNKVRVIVPQELNLDLRIKYSMAKIFSVYSEIELINIFLNNSQLALDSIFYIAVNVTKDSIKMFNIIKSIKDKFKNVVILAGPIQNPELFSKLLPFCDFISIGNSYLDSSNLFHIGIVTLIQECVNRNINKKVKIIVDDPECNSFQNMTKCLALGADYIMVGEDFCRLVEANGLIWQSKLNNKLVPASKEIVARLPYSTNIVDEQLYRSFTNTRENFVKIEYKLVDYLTIFKNYLKTCFSMTFTTSLNELHDSKSLILCTY